MICIKMLKFQIKIANISRVIPEHLQQYRCNFTTTSPPSTPPPHSQSGRFCIISTEMNFRSFIQIHSVTTLQIWRSTQSISWENVTDILLSLISSQLAASLYVNTEIRPCPDKKSLITNLQPDVTRFIYSISKTNTPLLSEKKSIIKLCWMLKGEAKLTYNRHELATWMPVDSWLGER